MSHTLCTVQDSSDCWSPDGWLQNCKPPKTPWPNSPSLVHARNGKAELRQPSRKRSLDLEPATAVSRSTEGTQHGGRYSATDSANVARCNDSSSSSSSQLRRSAGPASVAVCMAAQPAPVDGTAGDLPVALPVASHALPQQCLQQAEAAVAADTAAAMAAWLIHQPDLLQAVLAQLETFAAQAATPAPSPVSFIGRSEQPEALMLRGHRPSGEEADMQSCLPSPAAPGRDGVEWSPPGRLSIQFEDTGPGSTAAAGVQQSLMQVNQQSADGFDQQPPASSACETGQQQADARSDVSAICSQRAEAVADVLASADTTSSVIEPSSRRLSGPLESHEAMCHELLDHCCVGRYIP